MKQTLYLFLCLYLMVMGCTPDDDDDAQRCVAGDLEGLRCVLSQTSWKLSSVRSDNARDNGSISTNDWLAFQPSCYEDVTLTIPGFIEQDPGTVIANLQVVGDVGACDDRYLISLETTDLLSTADVLYQEAFSLYMFGDSLPRFGNVSEQWYDISYTEEVIDFSVDKSIDSTDYKVDVRLVRFRQ